MVKVFCRTNIDDYKGKDWPNEMVCQPVKGDAVRAKCGAILHVVGVTHAIGPEDHWNDETAGIPYLIVELHRYYPSLDSCSIARREE